jgi:hypothetical protein
MKKLFFVLLTVVSTPCIAAVNKKNKTEDFIRRLSLREGSSRDTVLDTRAKLDIYERMDKAGLVKTYLVLTAMDQEMQVKGISKRDKTRRLGSEIERLLNEKGPNILSTCQGPDKKIKLRINLSAILGSDRGRIVAGTSVLHRVLNQRKRNSQPQLQKMRQVKWQEAIEAYKNREQE